MFSKSFDNLLTSFYWCYIYTQSLCLLTNKNNQCSSINRVVIIFFLRCRFQLHKLINNFFYYFLYRFFG